MKTEINIFDLDGVLIDSSHRYRTLECGTKIDLDYWRENCTPEKIAADGLLPHIEYYKDCVKDPNCYVIIATAREMTQADFEFIEKHLEGYNKLIYRKTGETTKGWKLKCNAIKPLLNLRQFKNCGVAIFEDNLPQLRKMARILNATPFYVPSEQGH